MTATLEKTGTLVLDRVSFRFSPDGSHAACLAIVERDHPRLEAWSFRGASAHRRPLEVPGSVEITDQLLPLDDGRILLCRNRETVHEIAMLDARCVDSIEARLPSSCWGPRGGAVGEEVLAVVESLGLRLLPSLGAGSHALAIETDSAGCSTIWRVTHGRPRLERVIELPGLLYGGAWLDEAGTLLGLNRAEDGGPIKAGGLDLRTGEWTPLLHVSTQSNDRLLLAGPRSGLVVVSTDAAGEDRLGWARLGSGEPVRFPEALHHPSHAPRPLTLDTSQERVLVHLNEGVRSCLVVYSPAKDHLTPVEIPAGQVRGTAYWDDELLRFPFSTPAMPPAVATVGVEGGQGWSVAGESGEGWEPARIERLDGPAGPIEAIVYGGEGWRRAERLVVALHGGPADAWRFEFDPLFQALARAGIAVVALNPRGSTGYGAAHADAIHGAWGGPDVEDILAVARSLTAERGHEGLMLLGISYGAFLALLCAARESSSWSHCAAIAPFLSGPRLYADGSPAVRGLLERLGGHEELGDAHGPRDVLRLCPAITAKLLIVHGDHDELIPVSHSRLLRGRLLGLGRCEGLDLDYVEVPDGHEVLGPGGPDPLQARIVRFLRSSTTPRKEVNIDANTGSRRHRVAAPAGNRSCHGKQHRDRPSP
ncbi:MAG: alpha/beta hydrolase family protein [Egibacteraceae bacterium]